MAGKPKMLSTLQKEIIEELKKSPDGLDIDQIRERVHFEGNQQHLDKRVRETYPFYILERSHVGRRFVYKYVGERPPGTWDYGVISKTLQAKIRDRDGRRCRMCGKTVDEDHIKTHVDHMIPREWGGETVEENLWTLCSSCNEGKKNYFASFDPELMERILHHKSPHRRIVSLLESKLGEWVDSDLIQFVANFQSYQEDWQKRLRDLRYTGLKIEQRSRKIEKRKKSFYRVMQMIELPEDITAFVQRFERERSARNRSAH